MVAGTGKTTIARKMGKLFHSLGLLPCEEVVEITPKDLTNGIVGQTGIQVSRLLSKARGKVLFIDEAYTMNPAKGGQYMQEAVDCLVGGLTSEEYKGKLVVILAGYEHDIDEMLEVNAGLRSRFSEKMFFKDLSLDEAVEMFNNGLLKAVGLTINSHAQEGVRDEVQRLKEAPQFGNGRDMEHLVQRTFREFAKVNATAVDVSHVAAAVRTMLTDKRSSSRPDNAPPPGPPAHLHASMYATASASVEPRVVTTARQAVSAPAPPVEEEEKMSAASSVENTPPEIGAFEKTLQKYLDERGLNDQSGVNLLATTSIDSMYMRNVATDIAGILKISLAKAEELLIKWQSDQANVRLKLQEQKREQQRAKKEKRKALVPIWRCAVCGLADQPFIACYVSPYVVRYEEVDMP